MYSVVILDDEPWGLIGLRNSFRWDRFGFGIDLEAGEPQHALDYILKNHPDVVFTDIRMDGMSGLDLMRKAREAGSTSEFIIVSGHDDFCYAQEAIRLGVFRYLLKPLDIDKTDDILRELSNQLRRSGRTNAFERYRQIAQDPSVTFAQLRVKYNLNQSVDRFCVIGVDGSFEPELLDNSICSRHGVLVPQTARRAYLILQEEHPSKDLIKRMIEGGIRRLGISLSAGACEGVFERLRQADIALYGNFTAGDAFVCRYKKTDPALMREISMRTLRLQSLQTPEKMRETLNEIRSLVEDGALNMDDIAVVYNHIVTGLGANSGVSLPDNLVYMDSMALNSQFCDLSDLFSLLLDSVGERRSMNQGDAPEKAGVLPQILAYIHDHFDKSIYLQDLANRFFISPSYICDLFRKHLGKTFSEYLSDLRIDRAADLLMKTGKSAAEISELVGYRDYYYFTKVFKTRMGISPQKYRDRVPGGSSV